MHDRYVAVAASMLQLYAVRIRYDEMGGVLQQPTAVMAVLALALNAAACRNPGNGVMACVAAALASVVWAVLAATVCAEQAEPETAAYLVLLLCAFYYGIHHVEDSVPAALGPPQQVIGQVGFQDTPDGKEARITSPLRMS